MFVGDREHRRGPHHDLGGVLHDVSNALTVLIGWVDQARDPEASPESVAYALRIIEQRARIARDLARSAIGSPTLAEPLPLGAVVRDVVDALAVEAKRVGVEIVITGEEGMARVPGALDLSQVMTNLLLNALAHAPQATTVRLEWSLGRESAVVVVSDEGPGIAEARREAIFQGESLRPGGAGVGLRHCRALARASGGDVELLSNGEGTAKGATFRLTWPRVDVVPRPPVSSSRFRELAGLRVLVVEDDVAVTQLLETALEARGASVRVVRTRPELHAELDAARDATAFDVALVDLSPVAEDVPGSLKRLREASPGIELVLITGSADRLPEAIASEGLKLVQKPFELAEIVSVLKKT